jgi:hypothetical protein
VDPSEYCHESHDYVKGGNFLSGRVVIIFKEGISDP